MGHLGLTPQSVHAMGGFKVQGREQRGRARRWSTTPRRWPHAGCFAIVLEGVPDEVARLVTDAVDVPTIGIGAGPHCDGQVLVFHDLLGIEDRIAAQVRAPLRLAEGRRRRRRSRPSPPTCAPGRFPADDESYHLTGEVAEALGLYGSGPRSVVSPARPTARGRTAPASSPPSVSSACAPGSSAARPAPAPRPQRVAPGVDRAGGRHDRRGRPCGAGARRGFGQVTVDDHRAPTATVRDALPAGGRHRGAAGRRA